MDAIDRVPRLQAVGAHVKEHMRNERLACQRFACSEGYDLPEYAAWTWPGRP